MQKRGLGYLSQYSDLLRTGLPVDRIPVGANFPQHYMPALGPTQYPIKWVLGALPGDRRVTLTSRPNLV